MYNQNYNGKYHAIHFFIGYTTLLIIQISYKNGRKRLDNTKRSAIDAPKTISKRTMLKTGEATGDLL